MPEAKYIRENKKLIRRLEKKDYFPVALVAYNQKLSELSSGLMSSGLDEKKANKQAIQFILSHLHDVMRNAQGYVEKLISERIDAGIIKNADQARKSAAGNIFQQMFAYSLAKNIICGNITVPVTVTTSVSGIIDQYAAINVDSDIMRPDSDVIVFSEECKDSPILNFSCKTSCRERAGQTYKWKLLCDLATCKCEHKEGNKDCPATKYNLAYEPTKEIKFCFVTTDFYGELNNPQISAMFNFFDYSYVAKTNSPTENIRTLQSVIEDINVIFG